ncbi:MAG: hypothetical protein QOH24_1574 [Verrucomicrobiota bacterium]
MQSGPIPQCGRRMKMANDFDCAGVFSLAIAMMKFESVRGEGVDKLDDLPQLPIVVACDCDDLAIFTGGGKEFPHRLGPGSIMDKIAYDD